MDLIWVRVVLYHPSNSDPQARFPSVNPYFTCLELDRRFRRLQNDENRRSVPFKTFLATHDTEAQILSTSKSYSFTDYSVAIPPLSGIQTCLCTDQMTLNNLRGTLHRSYPPVELAWQGKASAWFVLKHAEQTSLWRPADGKPIYPVGMKGRVAQCLALPSHAFWSMEEKKSVALRFGELA